MRVFSTCPQSKDVDRDEYAQRVAQISRWSEDAGCEGILVYSDNGLVDPWLVSDLVLESTERLAPLVAIQPVYMHPYTAAKMVSARDGLASWKSGLQALEGTTYGQRLARELEAIEQALFDADAAHTG